jgi:hypothetical protein
VRDWVHTRYLMVMRLDGLDAVKKNFLSSGNGTHVPWSSILTNYYTQR